MAHSIGNEIRRFKPAMTSVLMIVSVFAAIYASTIGLFGVGRSEPVRPVVSYNAAQDARCLQFVAMARSEFGPDWKRRLDPGNTACAQQIQTAWERDWTPRQALPDPVLPQTTIGSARSLVKIAPPEAVPTHGPEAHSPAKAAIIADAGARFADSDAANQDIANASETSTEQSDDPGSSADEGRDEGEVGKHEQVPEPRRNLPGDAGANDGQAGTTRELNNQQWIDHDRARKGGIRRSGDDDSDADQEVDRRDSAEH